LEFKLVFRQSKPHSNLTFIEEENGSETRLHSIPYQEHEQNVSKVKTGSTYFKNWQ